MSLEERAQIKAMVSAIQIPKQARYQRLEGALDLPHLSEKALAGILKQLEREEQLERLAGY